MADPASMLPPGFQVVQPPADPVASLPPGFKVVDDAAAPPPGGATAPAGDWGTYIKGLVRSAAQGATFNWADEIEAGARALGGGDRKMILARIRDEIDQFKKENPKAALAAELGGGFAVPGLGTMKAISSTMKAAPLLGRMAVAGTVAGAEGAVSGAGASEDETLAGMAKDGMNAVPVSAGIGAVIPAAGVALKSVGRNIAGMIPEGAPGIGRLTQGVRERQALEETERALRSDALNSGTSYAGHLGDIRREIAQDAHSQRGTGNASILSASENTKIGGARSGDNVAEIASDAARRSDEAQGTMRDYARTAENARPGDAEYQALYARGVASRADSRAIGTLMTGNRQMRRIEALARDELQLRGPVPPPGRYSPELVDLIDRRIQKSISEGDNTDTLKTARNVLNALSSRAWPTNQAGHSLEDLKYRYGVGSDQARKAEKTFGTVDSRPAERVADEAVRAGSALAAGRPHLAAFGVGRTIMKVVRGDMNRGEALTRILTTRASNQDEMQRILNALENMPQSQRDRYIDAAISMEAQQVGANKRPLE